MRIPFFHTLHTDCPISSSESLLDASSGRTCEYTSFIRVIRIVRYQARRVCWMLHLVEHANTFLHTLHTDCPISSSESLLDASSGRTCEYLSFIPFIRIVRYQARRVCWMLHLVEHANTFLSYASYGSSDIKLGEFAGCFIW